MEIIRQLQMKKGFTSTECDIADYLLAHADEIERMGISELADSSYCSNATILRMVRKLGAGGYKEFRVLFAKENERRKKERQDVNVNDPFFNHASASVVLTSVSNIMRQAVEDTQDTIYPGQLDTVGRIAAKAKTIYIVADGDTLLSCLAFENMMNKIGKKTVIASRYHDSIGVLKWAGKEDIVLYVSYSGSAMVAYTKDILLTKKNGCPSVLISVTDKLPGIDYYLTLPDRERTVGKVAGYYSQESVRYCLNSLYGFVYSLDHEINRTALHEAEELSHRDDPRKKKQ